MKNIQPLMKRVGAYLIDIIIVMMITTLITSIPPLKKKMEEYQKTYQEYTDKYNEYSEYLKLLTTSYEDNEITNEEYDNLIKNETYQELITEKYKDGTISKGEYKEIVSKLNEDFDKTSSSYVYILNKKAISNTLISILITLIYFGVIQYFLKGETIGKKILKLKVVSANDKPLTIINYLLRSLIVNNVLLNTIGIIFLSYTSKKIYLQADNVLNILLSIIEALIIFLVLTRDDQRGLHDLLFNTKVVSTAPVEEPEKLENQDNKKMIIEPEVIEETPKLEKTKTSPAKSNNKNHQNTKSTDKNKPNSKLNKNTKSNKNTTINKDKKSTAIVKKTNKK